MLFILDLVHGLCNDCVQPGVDLLTRLVLAELPISSSWLLLDGGLGGQDRSLLKKSLCFQWLVLLGSVNQRIRLLGKFKCVQQEAVVGCLLISRKLYLVHPLIEPLEFFTYGI